MVADHRHVQMLVERIDRERIGRIGRGRQAVHFARDPNDVGRVASACAFSVVRMDRASIDGRERVFQKPAFVQGVGMDLHLKIQFVGHAQARINR